MDPITGLVENGLRGQIVAREHYLKVILNDLVSEQGEKFLTRYRKTRWTYNNGVDFNKESSVVNEKKCHDSK